MNERIQAILNKLTELVTGLANKQDKLYSSGNNQNIKTINNNSVLGTGNINIEGFSGDYDDLTNKPIIPTVPTDISAFNNDSGYIKQVEVIDTDNDTVIPLTLKIVDGKPYIVITTTEEAE